MITFVQMGITRCLIKKKREDLVLERREYKYMIVVRGVMV